MNGERRHQILESFLHGRINFEQLAARMKEHLKDQILARELQ